MRILKREGPARGRPPRSRAHGARSLARVTPPPGRTVGSCSRCCRDAANNNECIEPRFDLHQCASKKRGPCLAAVLKGGLNRREPPRTELRANLPSGRRATAAGWLIYDAVHVSFALITKRRKGHELPRHVWIGQSSDAHGIMPPPLLVRLQQRPRRPQHPRLLPERSLYKRPFRSLAR